MRRLIRRIVRRHRRSRAPVHIGARTVWRAVLATLTVVLVAVALWPSPKEREQARRAQWERRTAEVVEVVEPVEVAPRPSPPAPSAHLAPAPPRLPGPLRLEPLPDLAAPPPGPPVRRPVVEAEPEPAPVEIAESEPAPQAVEIARLVPLEPVQAEPAPEPVEAVEPGPPAIEVARLAPLEPVEAEPAAPAPRIVLPEPPGEPAWLRYAAAPPATDGRPAIAVVIDDLGMNPRGTERIAALPGPLTLAFLPYGRDLAVQSRMARAAGHEVLVHVPMEPIGSDYPGPNALLTELDAEENLRRLRWGLERVEGYVGINNHMGSRFTQDREALAPVMAELRARGLLFLDSRTIPGTVAAAEAGRHGVPSASRHVFLDHVIEAGPVWERLREVEQVARSRGAAIAIGHPHRVTMEALEAWLPEVQRRGFVLVPVSTLVAEQACRERGHAGACRLLAGTSPRLAARAAHPPPAP